MDASTLHVVIDIGTVTCRLYVATCAQDGSVKELLRRSTIVNLGLGVDKTGRLQPEAMQRVDALVGDYLHMVEDLREPGQAVDLLAVATSASRDAVNSQELVDMLAARGVQLDIIAGEQEAAYCFAGATAGREGERLLVVDIGGGSTELMAGMGCERPLLVRSFNMGCRRATERFLHSDPPTEEELEQARRWCRGNFAPYFQDLDEIGFRPEYVVAVAGTATSVVSIDRQMHVYDRSQVHNAVVRRSTLDAVSARLAVLSLSERKQVVGLQPQRADVIVAGTTILQAVLDLANVQEFTVSECDLLMGAVLQARN